MDFDIRTPDSAYEFVLWMTGLRGDEFIEKYNIDCHGDLDAFWDEIVDIIIDIDVRNIRIVAFHVLGSLDNCAEIKRNGLRDLQYVLREDTELRSILKKANIEFDIDNRQMICEDNAYNVDYEYYRNLRCKSQQEKQLDSIAHRIYYDFCVNGFLLNDNVKRYGTDIHERPEFLHTLCDFSSQGRKVDLYWRNHSQSYVVTFYATVDQVHRFNFNLDETVEELTDDDLIHIERWMLSLAIDRAFDGLSEEFLYIKDDEFIPPEQIISYELLE